MVPFPWRPALVKREWGRRPRGYAGGREGEGTCRGEGNGLRVLVGVWITQTFALVRTQPVHTLRRIALSLNSTSDGKAEQLLNSSQ